MWIIGFSNQAHKQLMKLNPEVRLIVTALAAELAVKGPMVPGWKNFGKLRGKGNCFHCHLKSGRPTYVACWEVIDKKIKIMEIYYVGTHEKAPY